MQTFDCVIVGAGISGLSLAYELQQRTDNILVIEKENRVGGALWSEQQGEGFTLEHGAQTVSSSCTDLWHHFDQLGIQDDVITAQSQLIYLPQHGNLQPLSLSPLALMKSSLLPVSAKLRVLLEPVMPSAPTHDESIRQFFTRRFGATFCQTIVEPLVSGVYAGSPQETSVQAMFPAIWRNEQRYGSLTLGLFATIVKERRSEQLPRTTFTMRGGLARWPRALAAAIGTERIKLATEVVAITPDSQRWLVTLRHNGVEETVSARRVVLTTPSHATAGFIAEIEPMTSRALQAIAYPPLVVVHLGYRRADIAHSLNGMGVLCPVTERCASLGTLWMSSIFAERAPVDMALVTAFVGGSLSPALTDNDDATIVTMVQQEQQQHLGITTPPVYQQVVRWHHSIPQYGAGHNRCAALCNRLEARWPGIYLLNNYRKGFSVEQCWLQARELAQQMIVPK